MVRQRRLRDAAALLGRLPQGPATAAWRAIGAFVRGEGAAAADQLLLQGERPSADKFASGAEIATPVAPNLAAHWLDRVVDIDGACTWALQRLALIFHSTVRLDEALRCLQRASETGGMTAAGWALRANIWLDKNHFARAREDFAQAVRQGGTNADVLAGMAVVYAQAGQSRQAECAVTLARREGSPSTMQLRLWVRAASLSGSDQLLELCLAQVDRSPRPTAEILSQLATCACQHDRHAESAALWQRHTKIYPDDVQGWLGLAEAQGRQGSYGLAAEALRRAAGLDGGNPSVHVQHGHALLAALNGAAEAALAAFERALALDDRHVPAQRGLAAACLVLLQRAPHDQRAAARFVRAAVGAGSHRAKAAAVVSRLPAALRDELAAELDMSAILTDGAQAAGAAAKQGEPGPAGLTPTPLPGKGGARDPIRMVFLHDGQRLEGAYVGRTYDGRSAVLTEAHGLVWCDWGVSPARGELTPELALISGCAFLLAEAQSAALQAKLARVAMAGGITASHIVSALDAQASCFVTGGTVRDLLAAPSTEAAGDIAPDVDLSTPLPPNMVRMVAGRLFAGKVGRLGRPAGIVSAARAEFFGLIKFGTTGVQRRPTPSVDVLSMRAYGASLPRQAVLGARTEVLPLAFGPDLLADAQARDFTCNALYARGRLVLDPLGRGCQDATDHKLVLCAPAAVRGNESLGFRYLHMRGLGFTPAAATVNHIRDHFSYFLNIDGDSSDAWLKRCLGRPEATRPPRSGGSWRQSVQRVLLEDGFGALGASLLHRVDALGLSGDPTSASSAPRAAVPGRSGACA